MIIPPPAATIGKIENLGPVGSKQYPIKDTPITPISARPVGNEFLEIIVKQLDIIKEKDERIKELTDLLLRQNNIIGEIGQVNQEISPEKEKLGNTRWNRVKSMLEKRYSKPAENNIDYSTAAENAALELEKE